MVTEIYISDSKLDLFKDENIDFNSSVANTDDITKINTDFTKSFTVPASDKNNFTFKHYYNADIDNTFDARVKIKGEIKIDGFPFRVGKFRLEKVSIKNGKASSYTINFWADLISVKDLIADDELSKLDLLEFNHSYDINTVQNGLQNGLFNRDVIYTIDNSLRRYIYDTNVSNVLNDPKIVNIAQNNSVNKGIRFTDLRPSLRLSKIMKSISDTYNLGFNLDFFEREEIKNIYLWANNNIKNVATTLGKINFTQTDSSLFNLETDTLSFETFVNNSNDKKRFSLTVEIEQLVPQEDYQTFFLQIIDNQKILYNIPVTNGIYSQNFIIESNEFVSHNFSFKINANNFPEYSASLIFKEQNFNGDVWIDAVIGTASTFGQIISLNIDIANNLPKIKTIDFLSGVFKMFKLLVIPNQDGTIYLNTANAFYRDGTLRDFTKYFDVNNYDVDRGVLARQIDFKFQEPTTILNKQFKQNNTVAYGDSLLTLNDVNNTPLDGEKIDVVLPFETIIYERLNDLQTNEITNISYGLAMSEALEPVIPKPILFYNNIVNLNGNSIAFENGNSIFNNLNTAQNTLGLNTVSNSLLFNNEFSTWNGAFINNTLYSNYWQNYIQSIFNIKKRSFKFNANLPTYLLTQIKLNDVIKIKDNYFTINDYNINLLDGDATFNLINNFDTNFNLFAPSKKDFYINFLQQTFRVYVSNSSVMNISIQDLGFGIDFISAVKNQNYIDITISQNNLIQNRDVFINVNNGSNKSFQIYLNQDNDSN